MPQKKNIFVIIGSASAASANLQLMQVVAGITKDIYNVTIYNNLTSLPHFNPELSADNPPTEILEFRNNIAQANGIIICTPEYIFSLPSGLKNAIEWCIATTVFMNKPTGLITASASGEKGHEALQLIMKTAMAKFTKETCLLVQGIKGKFDAQGNLTDTETIKKLQEFIAAFNVLIDL